MKLLLYTIATRILRIWYMQYTRVVWIIVPYAYGKIIAISLASYRLHACIFDLINSLDWTQLSAKRTKYSSLHACLHACLRSFLSFPSMQQPFLAITIYIILLNI